MTKDIINHLGENREEYFNAALPPIFSNSNFLFSKVEDMREAMISKNNIPFYTRGHNPTTKIFEKKIAALESTESAIALSSGMAAISTAILFAINQPITAQQHSLALTSNSQIIHCESFYASCCSKNFNLLLKIQ